MEEALKKLLESEVLDEETKTALQEAWNKKLQEVQVEAEKKAETKLREEYAQKFEADKNELVETMDKFLTQNLKRELEEFVNERKGLLEERAKLTKSIAQSRQAYKAKLGEHIAVLNKFVFEQLKKELTEFNADRKEVAEQKVEVAKKLREHRVALQNETATRIKKLEEFVLKQLTEELKDFQIDKKLLAETRTKLVLESKNKLEETRQAFIKRAATLVEATVENTLRKEIAQLKGDLKVARENNFGRRIFEAFGAEFMTSYLAEGTKVKAAMGKIDEVTQKLAEAETKLGEQTKLLEAAQQKVALIENQAAREKVLNDLLSPLSKDKKAVMEQMLEGVKTERLREQFNRYLDAVLKADQKDTGRRTIAESTETTRKVVTGDRANKLAETAKTEAGEDNNAVAELVALQALAGIKK